MQALKRCFALLDDGKVIVNRTSVMCGEHHILNRFVAVFFRYLAHGKEVAQRFAHLFVVYIDVTVVHPVVRIFFACAAFGLRNLIFMMWEN